MAAAVALLVALDTKADDARFLIDRLRANGHAVVVVDVGVLGVAGLRPDISREQVARAGGGDLTALRERADRGRAVDAMAAGAAQVVADLVSTGRVGGVLAVGGGAGTTIGATAMRPLPLGVPKMILTTLAAGSTAGYVGTSDIVLFPSVVDIAGLNRISAITYARAVDALSGMVAGATRPAPAPRGSRPLVAASMFGVTTPCVLRAKSILERAGCEVVVFHATGTGGRTLERLVTEGHVDAVLDLTTTEWADEVAGGILSAGPDRLRAAPTAGIPVVVSLGATDMINFGAPETVPERFAGRIVYHHNAENTLVRVRPDEAALIGAAIAEQLSASTREVIVLVPRNGVSALDAPGQPFDDPQSRTALVTSLRERADARIVRIEEHALHINDDAFANIAAQRLLAMLDPAPLTPAVTS